MDTHIHTYMSHACVTFVNASHVTRMPNRGMVHTNHHTYIDTHIDLYISHACGTFMNESHVKHMPKNGTYECITHI